jgi:hypothetical protein
MSTPSVQLIRKTIAVLKLPSRIGDLLNYLGDIYLNMSGNSRYNGSAAKLAIFTDEIKDLKDTQLAFKARPPTKNKEERDNAKKKAVLSAQSLQRDVQELADKKPEEAEIIITGANMSVKIITVRGPQQNDNEWGVEPDYLIIYAEGEGTHEWQSSEDGVTWTNDGATGIAKKTYPQELASKVKYSRNRQILRHCKYSTWSNPLIIERK